MLLAYSDLLNSPVAAADLGERIGSVVDVIAEASSHRVVALSIRTGGWFGATKLLSPDDVIEYDPHALIIPTTDALVAPAEIVRAHDIGTRHDQVLKRAVVTERGETLGSVVNFVIDTDTAGIVRYFVKGLLGPERIIPTTSILRVTNTAFVVSNSQGTKKIPAGTLAEA